MPSIDWPDWPDFTVGSNADLVRLCDRTQALESVPLEDQIKLEDLYMELERRGLLQFRRLYRGAQVDQYVQTGRYFRYLGLIRDLDDALANPQPHPEAPAFRSARVPGPQEDVEYEEEG